RLLLWAARHVLSLRAVHIPGHLNYGADLLSRGDPRAADWCLHPQVIDQIWVRFFRAQVDLFANRQPPTRHRRARSPVARSAPICFSPDPAPPASAVQGSGGGQGIDIDSPPLAQSAVGGRSSQYVSAAALGAASAERPPNASAQDSVAPPSGVVASQSLAPERCRLIASGLSDAVVATITECPSGVDTGSVY